jgi:hypothetical protein
MSLVRCRSVLSSSASLLLGSLCLFANFGCATVKVHLGMRLSLAKTPVTSMTVTQYRNPGLGPGEKSSLVATFQTADGKTLVTEGKGKGKVLWRDITVTPSVVAVDKKGVMTLPRDPRLSDGKTGHVALSVTSQPSITAALDVPLRYNYAFVSTYSGSSGSNGFDGQAGLAGGGGSPGSIDPNNPSAGGNGSDGGKGGDGSDGTDGGSGPGVQVQMTLRPGDHPLLQFSVTTAGRKVRYYLVDPQGGSLTVKSLGGSGGLAGRGGTGGQGGAGGSGIPAGNSGNNGMNGSDGRPGSNGNGGSISVAYDPSAAPFLSALHLSNPGGPQPVLTQMPVAPLW